MCSIDATAVIAVVAAIGAAYTTAALKLRRPDGARTRRDDERPTVVDRRTDEDDGDDLL